MLDPLNIATALTLICLGLVLGSFATALTYRELNGLNWFLGHQKSNKNKSLSKIPTHRSVCPKCKTVLKWYNLIPLFSYIVQKGKCSYCSEAISLRYPAIEITTLICVCIAYLTLGLTAHFIAAMFLAPFLVALIWVDFLQMRLPNALVLSCAIIGIVMHAGLAITGNQSWLDALLHLCVAIGYSIFSWLIGWLTGLLLKKEALGMGDVKFFFVAGLFLGLGNLPYFLLLSGVLGIIIGVLWKYFTKQALFPFGPALIVSFYFLFLMNGSLF